MTKSPLSPSPFMGEGGVRVKSDLNLDKSKMVAVPI